MIQNSKMTKRYDPDVDLQIANDDHHYMAGILYCFEFCAAVQGLI